MLPSDGYAILRVFSVVLFEFDDGRHITRVMNVHKSPDRIIECKENFNKKYSLRFVVDDIDDIRYTKFEDPDYLRFKIKISVVSIDTEAYENIKLIFNDYINEALFFELIRDGMLEGLLNFEFLKGAISLFNNECGIGKLSRKYIDEIKERLLTDIEKLELELI